LKDLEDKIELTNKSIKEYEEELEKINKDIVKYQKSNNSEGVEKLELIKQETSQLEASYKSMQQEYEKAKAEWNEENSTAKNQFLKLESETVDKKVQCTVLASQLDSLMLMYEQCIKDLKSYGKTVEVKFKSADTAAVPQ
jgi:predicted RNase H-like nuclease (RuvC/YqgF family)